MSITAKSATAPQMPDPKELAQAELSATHQNQRVEIPADQLKTTLGAKANDAYENYRKSGFFEQVGAETFPYKGQQWTAVYAFADDDHEPFYKLSFFSKADDFAGEALVEP